MDRDNNAGVGRTCVDKMCETQIMQVGVAASFLWITGESPIHTFLPSIYSYQIAIEMLQSGKVDAVVCVQSDENDRWGGGIGVRRRYLIIDM